MGKLFVVLLLCGVAACAPVTPTLQPPASDITPNVSTTLEPTPIPLDSLTVTDTPVPTPLPQSEIPVSQISVTADSEFVRVGETVTLTVRLVNVGIPVYTIVLDSGRSFRVGEYQTPEAGQFGTPQAAKFELISDPADILNGTVQLRAVAVGEAQITIRANGEAAVAAGSSPNQPPAFSWVGVADTIILRVVE